MKPSRKLPSALALGLLQAAGRISQAEIDRIADKTFGNVDLSTKEDRTVSEHTQEQLISKAEAKRARRSARRMAQS